MTFYEYINGQASNLTRTWSINKQENNLSNNQFTHHSTEKTKHNYGDIHYDTPIWYVINFQWAFGVQLIGGGW